MAHVVRIIKAGRLKHRWKHYQEEKAIGLNEEESDSEFSKESKRKQAFHKIWLRKLVDKIKTPKTIENFVFKSLTGFIGGVLLTYIFFFFFYVGVSFSIRTTTYICGLVGMILCLGLAFSSKIRCYVLLMLPVFFSIQGRQALLAYAVFLAFTGPARNSMHNMGILSDSMTCGQEIVKRTLKQVIEMVKAPFKSVKETMEKLTKSLKEVIESVKSFVMKIKRIIVSVLNVIKKVTTWLGSIINFCNKKVGTPFQRCMKTFDDAITDCKAKLGVMDFLCHVVHIVKALCYTVKWLDFICMFTEFVSDKIIGAVKKSKNFELREFSIHMKTLFYVSIEFTHSYEFETKASNTTREVAKIIFKKISKKVEKLQSIFSVFGSVFSLFFLFVFFKVYYYKYKYLSSDRYDNVYINKYIVDLDIKRAEMDRETVLPLELREKRKYAKPTAIRLLSAEKTRMTQSMFFLALTSFKIITFLVVDYSLFWVLMTIYEAGYDALEEAEKSKVGLHVEGNGILARFYRNLGKTFEVPENPNMHLTPLHCLPDPVPPDMGRYIQIGFLVSLCWILTVTEAYGLRLRNIVMSHYYPDRARERAVWLYNHILRSRGSFLRFARRQLRRKFGGESVHPIEKVTLAQRLFANFPLLGALFGKSKENNCLLCGAPESKKEPLKRCRTPDCPGRYCIKCYATLENVCTICQHPIEYGDVSDISEEIDSSEEEFYNRKPREESDRSEENEKFLTFKDMELRDKFKDVESNKVTDFAKLGDLYHDKEALKRRIKSVLNRRMQKIKEQKDRKNQEKTTMYKNLKSKVQKMLTSKKQNQVPHIETPPKENPPIKSVLKTLWSGQTKPTKSRVSFKLEDEEPKLNYKQLKDEVRAKIAALKKKKSLEKNSPNIWQGEESEGLKKRGKSEKGSDEGLPDNFSAFYFVEKERNFDFYLRQPDWFDEWSDSDPIFFEEPVFWDRRGDENYSL